MKAIPRQPKPAILAFNFEGERYDTLKALCDELEVGLTRSRRRCSSSRTSPRRRWTRS